MGDSDHDQGDEEQQRLATHALAPLSPVTWAWGLRCRCRCAASRSRDTRGTTGRLRRADAASGGVGVCIARAWPSWPPWVGHTGSIRRPSVQTRKSTPLVLLAHREPRPGPATSPGEAEELRPARPCNGDGDQDDAEPEPLANSTSDATSGTRGRQHARVPLRPAEQPLRSVRSFSTNSRPTLRAASGRPRAGSPMPAASGEPAPPSTWRGSADCWASSANAYVGATSHWGWGRSPKLMACKRPGLCHLWITDTAYGSFRPTASPQTTLTRPDLRCILRSLN